MDVHRQLGASIGEFGGVTTAIDYGSVLREHNAVRRDSGIFDLSHMTLILLKGRPGALLERVATKKIREQKPMNMIGPTLFLNERGGIKDDVMIYKLGENEYLVVGNAVNHEKDLVWLESNSSKQGLNTSVIDANEELALLALQGPNSSRILGKLNSDVTRLRPLEFKLNVDLSGVRAMIVSRSGWTGEDGFEFVLSHDQAEKLFRKIVDMGVQPCGLAARDSLRIEMGYYLYGNEIDETTSPIESRYWIALDTDKLKEGSCIGCENAYQVYKRGVSKVLVGLRLSKKERTIPRKGASVIVDEETIVGKVTSGGYSPVLKRPLALAYVEASHALMGMRLNVVVRGKTLDAKVVDFPFIK